MASEMRNSAECEYLEWDSEFFGRRIARTKVSRLTDELAGRIDEWCALERVECLYFLADSTDRVTMRIAQSRGFRFVDTRLTLERSRDCAEIGEAHGLAFRDAEERDIPALREIARNAHKDSRFYYDGTFTERQCDELYETWIEKSCRGWAKKVFVAGTGAAIEGYVTCQVAEFGIGQIGLVGVKATARGKGLGRGLVMHAVRWFEQEGAEKIRVVTQGRNVAAQRLYQKCGFASSSMGIWFHRWFSPEQVHA
jgi:dTDP-4-amino-4,6-dideoxy-D-galactose acyltransferase